MTITPSDANPTLTERGNPRAYRNTSHAAAAQKISEKIIKRRKGKFIVCLLGII